MSLLMSLSELEAKCLWVRQKVLQMAVRANSGHVSTAMSQTELLVALYFGGILRYDPTDPKWEDRDYFLLSKGQGGIGYYPVLASAGFFPESDLDNFCGVGSCLGVHSEWNCPGIETISGSLGHGLPIGTGIARTLKDDGKDNLVFVMTGDGELHEGSNWEAMFTAAHLKLDNLVVIVDNNDQATLGHLDDNQSAKDGPGVQPLAEKFAAFGFKVWEIDGNDLADVVDTLKHVVDAAKDKNGMPQCVIAYTKKGKGLSCMEDKRLWHYRVPAGADLEKCWEELRVLAEVRPTPVADQSKHAVAMRDRFFGSLYEHFKRDKNFVLIAADNGFPAIEKWVDTLPGQVIQVGIAEQEAVGMAAGMALRGRKPFVYAIAPFVTTRVHEFVKLDVAASELPITLVGVGAGACYDNMSTTHHCTEDIAIMRALPNLQIFSPADGTTAAAVADCLATTPKPSYVRLDRGGIDDIYNGLNSECLAAGMAATGPLKELCILSTGIMTHQALQVAGKLNATVVDVFRLKPFDHEFFFSLLVNSEDVKYFVTLEEHRLPGGLGSIVAETLVDHHAPFDLLRIGMEERFIFELGGREHFWKNMGLDVPSLVSRIEQWMEERAQYENDWEPPYDDEYDDE